MVDGSHPDQSPNEQPDLNVSFPQPRDLVCLGVTNMTIYEVVHYDAESRRVWITHNDGAEWVHEIVPLYRLHPYKDADL